LIEKNSNNKKAFSKRLILKGEYFMKRYSSGQIRNIALTGHAGSGKTSLAEAMLFTAGVIDRTVSIEGGGTVCDFDPEEIKRKVSLSIALAPLEWMDKKINIIDTPGLFDFEGEMLAGLSAADAAIIVISAKSGVSVGTEKAWKLASARNMPKAFFINKIDDDAADFFKVLDDIKARFGTAVCPVLVPIKTDGITVYIDLIEMKAFKYDDKGKPAEVPVPDAGDKIKELRTAISEAVAESDDEYFDKFFSGGTFTEEELFKGIHAGIKDGSITPVFCGSSVHPAGINNLLDSIVSMFPTADECSMSDEDGNAVRCSSTDPAVAFVFKTVADPFVGKLSYIKVAAGKLSSDSVLFNPRTGNSEKIGKITLQRGKKQLEADGLSAGDIGAAAKLSALTGDTLCAPIRPVNLKRVKFPAPCLSMAINAKNKGDDDKISQGLHRLCEEDPTLKFEINSETRQQIISGLGEQHLDFAVSKLKAKFGVEVVLSTPEVPYRETIKKKVVRSEGKYKKQTGGHGQFGHVFIDFEPCDSEEFIFEEKVVGGSVPRNFFPAVEKGLRDCIKQGVLAGFPVVNLKATLVDGSYHPVDSSEAAFRSAATLSFKAGLAQSAPVLLEPIGNLKAYVPEGTMGDIIGEINRRRGRVLGMTLGEDGLEVVEAEAPVAETLDFSTVLRSVTQGRGHFSFEFVRYEEAPPQVSQAVIEKAKIAAAAE
jgi:elongation factor G